MFPDIETAHVEALKSAQTENWKFLSAYNEAGMIAGGGTIGIELEDFSDVDIVVVCVGGGSLFYPGIASVLKANNPSIELWESKQKKLTFVRWFEAKQIVPIKDTPSIAPGLSGPIEPDTITFPIIRDHVDTMITISEDELIEGMKFMMEHHQQVVEPSGIAAVSAVMRHASMVSKKKVAIIVTGRNISF